MQLYDLVIVGGGAASAGLVTRAIAAGQLDALGKMKVLLCEKQSRHDWRSSLGRYRIYSNSKAGAFIEFLDNAPYKVRRALCDKPSVQYLAAHKEDEVHLRYVGAFVEDWVRCMHAQLDATANGEVAYSTFVRAVQMDSNGGFKVEVERDNRIGAVHTKKLIITAGARQCPEHLLASKITAELSLRDYASITIPVDALLCEPNLARILPPPTQGNIVIIGNSHSAWSMVWRLHNEACINNAPPHKCIVLQRNRCRVWYPDAAAARAHGESPTDRDICPLTGQVNRLSGLRGPARDLYLRLHQDNLSAGVSVDGLPTIHTMQLSDANHDAIKAHLDAAALIVPAFGYLKTLPPFTDDATNAAGRAIQFQRTRGHYKLTPHGRPFIQSKDNAHDHTTADATADAVANLWFMGLSSGFQPSAQLGGEPSFTGSMDGIWLYQHDIGAQVLADLLFDNGADNVLDDA